MVLPTSDKEFSRALRTQQADPKGQTGRLPLPRLRFRGQEKEEVVQSKESEEGKIVARMRIGDPQIHHRGPRDHREEN